MASSTTALSSLSKRLAALEAEVSSLRLQNEALKKAVPLEAITAGLHAAAPEDIQSWMDACNAVAEEYGELSAPQPKKGAKKAAGGGASAKKATTNSTGPSEWNKEVRRVWISLIQAAGGEIAEDAEGEDVKKAAKSAGVSYQSAFQEASRLRTIQLALDAGKDEAEAEAEATAAAEARAAKNAERKAKKGDDGASVSSKASAPKPKKAPAAAKKAPKKPSAEEEEFIAMMAEAGMRPLEIGDKKVWLEEESGKVFEYGKGGDMGDFLGTYDADTDEIVAPEEEA
jgi:hypothetical protein